MPLTYSKLILKGKDSEYGDSYIKLCADISKVSDNVFRQVFNNRPDFNKGKPISKHVPGPCGEDYLGLADFYLVLGTGDQVFKRILSATMSPKENIIFIAQSPAEAWWRENWGKNPKTKNNGNRVCSEKFTSVFNIVSELFNDQKNIMLIEIETQEANVEYHLFSNSQVSEKSIYSPK